MIEGERIDDELLRETVARAPDGRPLIWRDAAGGHPGGTGGSRWGTYIAAIDWTKGTAVPEPASWALMLSGFGLAGAALRRRRAVMA